MSPSVLFAGSGEFAKQILHHIHDKCNIKKVITQPARPAGKGRGFKNTPVFDLAIDLNIETITPDSPTDVYETFTHSKYDAIVVADYGKIIPSRVLSEIPRGILNIHPSLLPKYRGPSPIQSTILNGDTHTGVTIMQLDEKMDHGPILKQVTFSLHGNETTTELMRSLATLGANLLCEIIPLYLSNNLQPVPQDHSQATICKLIKKEAGHIVSNDTTISVERKLRALQPWPGVRLNQIVNGKNMWLQIKEVDKIHRTDRRSETPRLYIDADTLYLALADGSIKISLLQPEGKNTMTAKSFISGYRLRN